MLDIVGKRYWFFAISLFIIIPGSGTPPEPAQVVELYEEYDIGDASVQTVGIDEISARSKSIDDETAARLVDEMQARFDSPVTVLRFESVGPAVGAEVAERASGAVGLAALGILLYITYAFRGIPNAFRFGFAAIIAMIHDVAVVVGIEAIVGHFLGWEVDALFLTALLTVIGFSVHDSIVVFDRIRENQRIHRRLDFETLVNHSIVQTLDRSINTQLTVMLTLLALLLFGGVTTRHFVTILLIGVFSGTYSSIFNAAPLLVVWENREWRDWFKRSQPEYS
jgi:preprotein translocase subunit SecF